MTKHRSVIMLNGRGMTRAQMYAQETVPVSHEPKDSIGVKPLKGGSQYSIRNWVPPEKGERHMPGASYEGPGTKVFKRLSNNVQPTSNTDAASRLHDIAYYRTGLKLAKGEISKQEALKRVREADRKLVSVASKNTSSFNPVEKLHAWGAKTGIIGKMALEDTGLMSGLKFVNMSGNEPELPEPWNKEGGKRKKKPKPKKKNLIKGLEKRFQSLKIKKFRKH